MSNARYWDYINACGCKPQLKATLSIPTSRGTASDYNSLTNKPSIEGVTLVGDKNLSELGVEEASALDIFNIFMED